MRILYVTDALAIWGGMERVLVEKANNLASHDGYEVYMLTVCQGDHPFPFPLDPQVIPIDLNVPFHDQYQYSGVRRMLSLRRLHRDCREGIRRQLSAIRPDVIVCSRIELVGDISRVKGNTPLVFESHSSFWTSRFEGAGLLRRIHTWWMNQSAKKAQAVVALTEGDAAVWRKVNKKVYVIPDTVHLNETGVYSNHYSKSAIFVGRLSRQKNIGSLLAVWQLVRQRHPDWQLHVYGERGDIDEELYECMLYHCQGIVVHAPVVHIIEEYKKHAFLLLTSLYEPFGMVLPEAMSCGLPVVAFDCPYGPADIITDGIDGFLIKKRNITEYVDKVCLLMDSIDLREEMGKASIASAQRYSCQIIMPLWYKLFESQKKSIYHQL